MPAAWKSKASAVLYISQSKAALMNFAVVWLTNFKHTITTALASTGWCIYYTYECFRLLDFDLALGWLRETRAVCTKWSVGCRCQQLSQARVWPTANSVLFIINAQKLISVNLVSRTTIVMTPVKPQISKFQAEKSCHVALTCHSGSTHERLLSEWSRSYLLACRIYVIACRSITVANELFWLDSKCGSPVARMANYSTVDKL
jgi:hypothetical protein